MSDMIYRQDVIKILEELSACKDFGVEIGTDEETFIGKYEAITLISDLPTIEPKRGEWIEWIDCEGEVFWKCSACGQASEASVAGILYKFCPFCGADMREREGE